MASNEIEDVLRKLQSSKFRRRFRLGERELRLIRQKGLEEVEQHARQFITERLAPANPKNDGRQTPMRGHPVFIAQHATATCCRGCLQKWHNITKGKALDHPEYDYILEVLMTWIRRQTPDMGMSGHQKGLFDFPD